MKPNKSGKPVPELALRVENLQFKTGLISVLKNIKFDLTGGEAVALLGPNGSGKSTLLKCLAGLLPHTGKIEVFGTASRKDPFRKRKLGYLGHETFLYSKLSAKENLAFYSELYGIDKDLDAVLEEYRLPAASEQLVETFSRGMKQRLALARTLLPSPELLLLDEPFTGLDQQGSRWLEEKILEQKGTVTIVMATHELERASEIADKVIILKGGRQMFFGAIAEMDSGIHDFYRLRTS